MLWTTPQSIPTIGKEFSSSYAGSGYTKAKDPLCGKYFRDNLAKRIEESRGRELPGSWNFSLFTQIMGEYVALWKRPAEKFRQDVSGALLGAAKAPVESATKQIPLLRDRLNAVVETTINETDATAIEPLSERLHRELLPSPENHYLGDTINKIRSDKNVQKVRNTCREPSGHA
jgi:hypothetical protein